MGSLDPRQETAALAPLTPAHGAPGAHAVQFYASEEALARIVTPFLAEGLGRGEALLVVATGEHLSAFEQALREQGHDLAGARADGRFVAVPAAEALSRFMVGNVPDARLFEELFGPLLDRARAASRDGRVRAYGEMVNLLWQQGNPGAVLGVEELWNRLLDARSFALLCAYSLDGFPGHEHASAFDEICSRHSLVAPGARRSTLQPEEVPKALAELEQRARALETEVRRSRQLEADLRAKVEQLDRAALRSSTLQLVTAALSRSLTTEEVANVVIGVAHDALRASASVAYVHSAQGPARLAASRGLAPAAIDRLRTFSLDAPLPLAAAIRTGAPQWLQTHDEILRSYPNLASTETSAAALQSVAALPLVHEGRSVGGIAFSFAHAHPFDAAEREFFLTLAAQCAAALERARVFEAERVERAESEILFRVTDATSRAGSLEEIYEAALDALAAGLGVSRASVLLFDPDGVMRFKAWRKLSDGYRAAVEGHSPWKPDEKNPSPILVEDVRDDPSVAGYLPIFEAERIGALGFFPLFSNGLLLGKFMLYYPGAHRFTDAEKRLAGGIANQVAFAVERRFAQQERERILGIVSHDLRNPLTAVTMASAMLLRQELEPRATKWVRRIANGAHRMERLIAQLLEFAQARHGGGIPIHRKPTELADVVARVVDELETAYPQNSIVVSQPGESRGDWDPDRIAEVFSNLIGNAVQHGGGSPVRVAIEAAPSQVTVGIHNGGPAIPTGLMPRLFDPYRRGDPKTGPGSVGLGLFISREIVRAHGGSIDVSSREPEGTTFTVRLPRSELERTS